MYQGCIFLLEMFFYEVSLYELEYDIRTTVAVLYGTTSIP